MKVVWLSALTFGLLSSLYVSPAIAASEFLDKAIAAYNAGKYSEAMGLLGEAESRDFNDPVLHYYLANTLSHLDAKDDAIKEYKIALAMEPEGKMAQYCHDALKALGAERKSNNALGDSGVRPGHRQLESAKLADMNYDKERMQDQIEQIEKQTSEIISSISRDTPDRRYAIRHFREEGQRKIRDLQNQFRQKWHLDDAN